jgi:hypothetical protein
MAVIPNEPPPIPPPFPVAESGQTTTEFWIAIVGNLIQAVIVVLVSFGIHITADQRMAILGLESTLVTAGFAAYAVARGLRKAGTQG